jgi:hypothetical protein
MDILTAAARVNRNLKNLSLQDQKAVIDFVQKSIVQRIAEDELADVTAHHPLGAESVTQ